MHKNTADIFPFKDLNQTNIPSTLLSNESRLQGLLDLSGYSFWEQDTNFCFKNIMSTSNHQSEACFSGLISNRLWDLEANPTDKNISWDVVQTLQNSHQVFSIIFSWFTGVSAQEVFLECRGTPVTDSTGRFTGYQGVIKDITQKRRRKKLYKLNRTITNVLLETHETDKTIRKAICTLCEAQNWEYGRYWHFDPLTKMLTDYDGWEKDNKDQSVLKRLKPKQTTTLGQGLVGKVAESSEVLWIKDIDTDPLTMNVDSKYLPEWKSVLLFPVTYQNKILGVLFFAGSHINRPDNQLLELINSFSDHIGYMFNRSMALKQLQESEERYASTIYLAASGIANIDCDGYLIDFNKQLCLMLGYTRQELLGRHVDTISHPDDVDQIEIERIKLNRANKYEHDNDIIKTEKRYIKKDGDTIWVSLSIAPKRNESGKHMYDIVVLEDITNRKVAEDNARYIATHDEMTGLPNRMLFGQFLTYAIETSNRYNRQFAVIFIDLDRFKIINDSMGHDAGDELIKKMGERFRHCVRASDLVARLGGDEFVILLQGFKAISDVETVAKNIMNQAARPVDIMGTECTISASAGISLYPVDAQNEKDLVKNADMAMYKAKEKGKNNFQFFTNELQSSLIEKIKMESCLRSALDNNEFSLAYQPKVDSDSCNISGVEVLLRWSSPELGPISPVDFIPLAEEIGVIMSIGKWVLSQACTKIQEWSNKGLNPVSIAVNLSPKQFADPELIPYIGQLLQETGIDPALLELEITETVMMTNVDSARKSLTELRNFGLEISVDDFGTGYSSLAHLKRFPIHTIKIDRSFISDINNDPEDEAIIQAIISMAQTLGLKVVAEGVETKAQHELLLSYGCDQLQGYYFSKPIDEHLIENLLKKANLSNTYESTNV